MASKIKFYVHWKHWAFAKTFRMNTSLMWGASPYTSYRFGPFEVRQYQYAERESNLN